jgi:hypothetical protein
MIVNESYCRQNSSEWVASIYKEKSFSHVTWLKSTCNFSTWVGLYYSDVIPQWYYCPKCQPFSLKCVTPEVNIFLVVSRWKSTISPNVKRKSDPAHLFFRFPRALTFGPGVYNGVLFPDLWSTKLFCFYQYFNLLFSLTFICKLSPSMQINRLCKPFTLWS